MTDKQKYIVCKIKTSNVEAFKENTQKLPGDWHLITNKESLTFNNLKSINPRYIFFPHWSWIVPDEIIEAYECVCFHMTDLPYGRGGSPLQNLIVRGHKETKLTALRMNKDIDAGPIYMKRALSLEGTATEILDRAMEMSYEMAHEIIVNQPIPIGQTGKPTLFNRRTPDMSQIPEDAPLNKIYDYIRMLDAKGYPNAFIPYGNGMLSFSNAAFTKEGELTAKVRFIKKED